MTPPRDPPVDRVDPIAGLLARAGTQVTVCLKNGARIFAEARGRAGDDTFRVAPWGLGGRTMTISRRDVSTACASDVATFAACRAIAERQRAELAGGEACVDD